AGLGCRQCRASAGRPPGAPAAAGRSAAAACCYQQGAAFCRARRLPPAAGHARQPELAPTAAGPDGAGRRAAQAQRHAVGGCGADSPVLRRPGMQAENDSLTVMLDAPDDFAGFRQAARVLLALGAAPELVHWRWSDTLATQAEDGDLF